MISKIVQQIDRCREVGYRTWIDSIPLYFASECNQLSRFIANH